MIGDYYKPGAWNAICDICGLRFKSDELRKNWKNQYVCSQDFEHRHPQDFLRVRKERIAVPWSRPEGDPIYVSPPVCWVWSQSAYADLGTADCMRADNASIPYPELLAMKGST